MMEDSVVVSVIIALSTLIVVPWCVFVTASIFSLKQQTALIRAEVGLLNRIQKMLEPR